MHRLTTKQQLAAFFGLYVFILLFIVYTLFLLIFHFTIDFQLKKEITNEATEIINTHLVIDQNAIVFVKDSTGSSLKEYLLQNDSSAIFLNNRKNILRTYGIFAIENENNDKNQNNLQKIYDSVYTNKTSLESNITWEDKKLTILSVPLKYKGELVGVLILGKSLGQIEIFSQLMTSILLGLGFLNLIGSLILGYFLAKKTLNPLRKMIYVIDQIDLDRLDNSVKILGHPDDELVILAERFNEMILRLKENALRQKEFLANASHELKTPLTRAITSLDLLTNSKIENCQVKEEIELVKQDLFNINTLIENLLLLSKLKKNDLPLPTKQDIDFEKLYQKLERQFQFVLNGKQITIRGHYPKIIPLNLPKEYLEIILSNLIGNAIKYSRTKTKIELNIKTTGKLTIIEVKDEGIGMEKNEIIKIFDRFFRARSREKGYGIGLSIVKQLCELYNIEIEVQSEVNKGTSVILTFNN